MVRLAPLILPLLLAMACTAPDIARQPETAAADAPYPRIAPLDPLLEAADGGTLDTAGIEAIRAEGSALEARGAALRNRPID